MKLKLKVLKLSSKKQSGMTVIELMMVIVVMGIIIAIAATNFVAPARKRALEGSVKANVRTLQIMLETYRVDNETYPYSLSELEIESNKKKYNKSASNPYTKQTGPVNVWAIDFLDPSDSSFASQKKLYEGKVAYQLVNTTKYYIMGYGQDGMLINTDNKIYVITNGG